MDLLCAILFLWTMNFSHGAESASKLDARVSSALDPSCPTLVRQAGHRHVKQLLHDMLKDNEGTDVARTYFLFTESTIPEIPDMDLVRKEAGCLNSVSFINEEKDILASPKLLRARNLQEMYVSLRHNLTTPEARRTISHSLALSSGFPDPFLLLDGSGMWLSCLTVGDMEEDPDNSWTQVATFGKSGTSWIFRGLRGAPHQMCNEGKGLYHGRTWIHVKNVGFDTGVFSTPDKAARFIAQGLGAKYKKVRSLLGPMYFNPVTNQLHEKCGIYMIANGEADISDNVFLDNMFNPYSDFAQWYMSVFTFYTQKPTPLPKYQSLYTPLDSLSWLLLVVAFFTVATLGIIIYKKDQRHLEYKKTSILDVILLFWGICFCENHSKIFVARPIPGALLRMIWLVSICFLVMFYNSVLKASMIKVSYGSIAENFQDVVKADAPIYVLKGQGFLKRWESSPFEDEKQARNVVMK